MYYRRILAVVATIAFLSGCAPAQPNFDAVYTQVSAATIQAGQPIPVLKQKPLFTITGKIQAKQAASSPNPAKPSPIATVTIEHGQATMMSSQNEGLS